VSEEVYPRIVAFPKLIEPKEGYIEQFVAAIRKVVDHHRELL
jgi:hypothetical protein